MTLVLIYYLFYQGSKFDGVLVFNILMATVYSAASNTFIWNKPENIQNLLLRKTRLMMIFVVYWGLVFNIQVLSLVYIPFGQISPVAV